MQLGLEMLIMGQPGIVQEAKVVPKAEELRARFGLRKWSGAVDTSQGKVVRNSLA